MCPSRTPRPRTSSSVLTNRGCWLRWAGFFTPRSASSPGRHSGENTQRVKATRQGSLQRCYLKSPLSQIYTPSVVRCLFFFFAFISDFVSRFDFYTDLQNKLQNPAKVVTVFDRVQMHGEKGAVATVDMPPGSFTNKMCETRTFEMFCA